MYDSIIIGGGHNGLTRGACLARGGQQVLVLAANETLGDFVSTKEFAAAPGFRSNPKDNPQAGQRSTQTRATQELGRSVSTKRRSIDRAESPRRRSHRRCGCSPTTAVPAQLVSGIKRGRLGSPLPTLRRVGVRRLSVCVIARLVVPPAAAPDVCTPIRKPAADEVQLHRTVLKQRSSRKYRGLAERRRP